MIKEKIFELVRKEDVVLWVGSGMSYHAGYPLANELKKNPLQRINKA